MFERVLPRHIDNTFGGSKMAVWLLALTLLVRMTQSVSVLVGGASVVKGADGIPLNTYAPEAAQTIVSVWALWAFTRLLIYLFGLLVLVRYRSMVPFMFGLLLIYDAGREIMMHCLPITRVGTPPGPVMNLVLTMLTALGLVLSLLPRRNRG